MTSLDWFQHTESSATSRLDESSHGKWAREFSVALSLHFLSVSFSLSLSLRAAVAAEAARTRRERRLLLAADEVGGGKNRTTELYGR